jgi:hypothetical protein
MVLASGCGDNQQPEEARMMWERLQLLDYANAFERAPGYEMRMPSDAPHGDQVDIYINDVLEGALASTEALMEWPLGSLIVKDGFDSDGGFELVAAMEQREDGWFYVEYTDRSGDALFSGQPSVCTDCHAAGDDFIRAFDFPMTP